jgi:hypothetical protein
MPFWWRSGGFLFGNVPFEIILLLNLSVCSAMGRATQLYRRFLIVLTILFSINGVFFAVTQ